MVRPAAQRLRDLSVCRDAELGVLSGVSRGGRRVMMRRVAEYMKANLANWDQRAPAHAMSPGYNVQLRRVRRL